MASQQHMDHMVQQNLGNRSHQRGSFINAKVKKHISSFEISVSISSQTDRFLQSLALWVQIIQC